MFRVVCWLLSHLLLVLAAKDTINGDIRPGVFQLNEPMYDYVASEIVPVTEPRNKDEYLLPTTTKPHHYNLWIKTRIDENNFDVEGKIGIEIEAIESTDQIKIHARELNIKSVILFESDHHTTTIDVKNFNLTNDDYGFFIINLSDMLVPQQFYYLEIEWTSVLRSETQYNGFYRSKYVDGTGKDV